MGILVTGATGFLGRAVVEELIKNGEEVYTTGKSAAADLPNYFSADISFDLKIPGRLENIETIIHTAGLAHQFQGASKNEFRRVNVEGTKNAAKSAKDLKVKNFVLISSVAVYGNADFRDLEYEEDAECKPSGDYAESKFESEKAAFEILNGSGVKLKILRPSTIVGENDRGNVARLIKAIDQGRFYWLGTGKNLKSLVYKNDAARACAAVLKNPWNENFEIYNITAEAVSMRSIVGQIEKTLLKSVPKVFVPAEPLRYGLRLGTKSGVKKIEKLSETVEKWLSDDVFSGKKIKTKLNFAAETDALEGVRREAEFYKTKC